MNNAEQIKLINLRIENLLLRQQGFEADINALKEEVNQLQAPGLGRSEAGFPDQILQSKKTQEPISTPPISVFPPKNAALTSNQAPFQSLSQPEHQFKSQPPSSTSRFTREKLGKSDFEKFIGENLISKIGILVLIIGVGIGAKYAIEHDMVSPLTRIILGYCIGAGLMTFAIKLKVKYENFSAVLVSGAIAIFYFITFAAYDFYALIPQILAFALMVVFTSFTIFAAIKYDKTVIAHIGLVGAYAVPFLLSDGSGKVDVLFSYMAIINIGILILSLTKYWKSLLYASFGLTWLIFLAWRLDLPTNGKFFEQSLVFSTLFFLIFYIANLAYKLRKKEIFAISDVIIILLNAFIYYGIGYFILSTHKNSASLLGLFTLANAIIHFFVAVIIFRQKLADKNLFYLVLAMVITFITIAVPVQLDGGWVTIFWLVEASLLFYLGRAKRISIYEKLSYPLIFLAFISLLQDWMAGSNYYVDPTVLRIPFFNVEFLTACIAIAAFTFLYQNNKIEPQNEDRWRWAKQLLDLAIPSMLLLVVYFSFRNEIARYLDNLYQSTAINTSQKGSTNYQYNFQYNYNYELLKEVCVYIYTILFAAVLTLVNLAKIKSKDLAVANLIINGVVIVAFLTNGLYILSELRDAFIAQGDKFFIFGAENIWVRYVAILAFVILIYACYKLSKSHYFKINSHKTFEYVFYISLLWIVSSELINILDLTHTSGSYKLALSILWGVFCLFLISMGLAQNKKFLRISAMVLFGITLLKLFFYDIAYLSTIAKTIVFVSLGVLLLIISFLYNKYKHLIIDDVEA